MLTDEALLLTELTDLAKKYDKAAEVLVVGSRKAGPEAAQALQVVTFAILVAPNNAKLRDALVGFGMSKQNEVELVSSGIDLQENIRLDVLQVEANIYYKGLTYANG